MKQGKRKRLPGAEKPKQRVYEGTKPDGTKVSFTRDTRFVWMPQPRQAAMMERGEFEALYGGAAGGGKSDYLICEATRQVHIPNYQAIIFRRTYPELTDLINRSELLYPQAFRKARFNKSSRTWLFPSGARIQFGAMQHEEDKYGEEERK